MKVSSWQGWHHNKDIPLWRYTVIYPYESMNTFPKVGSIRSLSGHWSGQLIDHCLLHLWPVKLLGGVWCGLGENFVADFWTKSWVFEIWSGNYSQHLGDVLSFHGLGFPVPCRSLSMFYRLQKFMVAGFTREVDNVNSPLHMGRSNILNKQKSLWCMCGYTYRKAK